MFVLSAKGTVGAVSAARQAMLHLARVNGWPDEPYSSGISLIPLVAARRLNRHQVKKAEGLTLVLVRQVLLVYCWVRPDRRTGQQWEFAMGVAIVVAYKVLARWDDPSRLQWDTGFCEVHELYIRFYLSKRKNAQSDGNFVEVARPRNPAEIGAYHVIRQAHALFRTGHILPAIDAKGRIDGSRFMAYKQYVQHLRACLRCIGVSAADAKKLAGQSARAGAATTAAREGVAPHEICRLAGVSSINWLVGYNRPDAADRQRASQNLGI